MPRANRHHIPGCIWHITYRCHKQEFLLKFEKDRKRWRHWLFEEKKRFGLSVLNYIVTSNHVHLLVIDTKKDAIPKSLQLIAGRTAQEFNIRKKRKGAFWEDRYHATAIQSNEHLVRCLVYIDLNMVRAGVVAHPSKYKVCGFNEIQKPPKRYSIIDKKVLQNLFSIHDQECFRQKHHHWIEAELATGNNNRNEIWSESVAVGSERFVKEIQQQLAWRAKGRNVVNNHSDCSVLMEQQTPYNTLFDCKKDTLRQNNTYPLNKKHDYTSC